MHVMVIVKANAETESGKLPSRDMLERMGAYNEELVAAGVAVSMNGLHPSKKGKRVRYGKGGTTVIDGPFAEAKELVGGYWIWKVASVAEALLWLEKAPFEEGAEVEVRPIFSPDDFGADFTPELRAQEERQVSQMKERHRDG